jgi:hypothetical protein
MRAWLDELREVRIGADVLFDGRDVAFESVRRQLHPVLLGDLIGQAPMNASLEQGRERVVSGSVREPAVRARSGVHHPRRR